MLKFSPANAKTRGLMEVFNLRQFLCDGKRKVYSLDLLSGYSCPQAKECLSKVVVNDGKRTIQDGPHTKFRCFSASQEALFPAVYNQRKFNFDLIRGINTAGKMAELIDVSLPKNLGICRIHVAGDFFNQRYFDAWLQVAKNHPNRLFYAYTKNIQVWINRYAIVSRLENFVLTASYGGKQDSLIEKHRLRHAKVVFSENEAYNLGLDIDHDDSHAADPSKQTENFALLIHGTQPKGTEAAAALSALKGKGSYGRKGVSV